nr:DUF421 domain-containing protein [Paenibacillus lemnae]
MRTLSSVVVLFLLTKLLGKRQASQLSFFEYITGITIGSLAAYISLDLEANWYLGIVALAVWVAVTLMIEFAQIKNKRVRDFIDFKARVLIRDGKIQEQSLKKERMSSDELMEQLRKKSVFDLADVEFAIMESSGEVNVRLVSEKQPLTPKDLNMNPFQQEEPMVVVMDGEIMEEPLKQSGKSTHWLNQQLKKSGVTPKEVYLGQISSEGSLNLDLYNDKKPLPEQKNQPGSLYAALKQCEVELELLSLSASNAQAKQQLQEYGDRLHDLLHEAKPLLKSKKQ